MTDTARLAHYVLPAKTMFEQEDLVTAYWHPYLQLRTKLWDPPGEVKTESEIWRLLSERFGIRHALLPARRRRDHGAAARHAAQHPAGADGAARAGLAARLSSPPSRSIPPAQGMWRSRTSRSRLRPARLSSPRRTPPVCGASIRSPTTRRSTRGTSRGSPRAIRCSCCRARRATGFTRSSGTSTGSGTSSGRTGSTCTRRTRRRAASRRVTRRPSGTTAAA